MGLKKMVRMIKREIISLKYSSETVDYYAVDSLVESLNDLRLRIVNDLNAKSPKFAFEMMLKFLDLHKNTIKRASGDRDGTVAGVFKTACKDFGLLAQNSNHLSCQETVKVVFARLLKDEYNGYGDIIRHFKDVLKDEGLNLLQEKIERAANEKNIYVTKHELKSIADCKNDVDLYIRACSFKDGRKFARDHLKIAERLVKHGRVPEALKWLDDMEIPNDIYNPKERQDRHELKIKALELDGNHAQAQIERIVWFEETLSPKTYRDILEAFGQYLQEAFRSDAIEKAFQFAEPHTALDFLVQVQEVEEVAKFARARFKELDGTRCYALKPAADLVKNTDPIAATLLYRKMVAAVLETKSNSYYNEKAVEGLATCAALNSKINIWEGLQRHDEYFKEIRTKHRRKRSFWVGYESAVRNQTSEEAEIVTRATQG